MKCMAPLQSSTNVQQQHFLLLRSQRHRRSLRASGLRCGAVHLVLYTKPDCPLCQGLSSKLDALQAKAKFMPSFWSDVDVQVLPGIEIRTTKKPRIVVLGTGWGAISFLKKFTKQQAEQYELVVISPRNYFLYTPLLPAVATGTMEERSIVEPIRNVMVGKGQYYEAICQDVDPQKQMITACFPKDAGFPECCFRMEYDHLVVSVGSVNNTFGVQGVQEHCYFFKSIDDANRLRSQVSECFERASLPYIPEQERKQLLSFVIVGGGPTGVEVAAELYDMVTQDMKRLYPDLNVDVRIKVVELMDYILSSYDRKIGEYTGAQFQRSGIELVICFQDVMESEVMQILNSRVTKVDKGYVTIMDKDKNESTIPFGACVWATGVAMNPLIKQLQEKLEGQSHFRSLITDDNLRVLGSNGSIWAIGDASTIAMPKALDYADELFTQADVDNSDTLTLKELRDLLMATSVRFPQFEEHARFLNTQTGGEKRFGGIVMNAVRNSQAKSKTATSALMGISESSQLTRDEFKSMLKTIDAGLRALPATAQVARQQGEYLAHDVFGHSVIKKADNLPPKVPEFKYSHKGALAYIGSDKAVADVPKVGPLWGLGVGLIWKGFETYSQFSWRNKALVSLDWLRTKIFGRDISRV